MIHHAALHQNPQPLRIRAQSPSQTGLQRQWFASVARLEQVLAQGVQITVEPVLPGAPVAIPDPWRLVFQSGDAPLRLTITGRMLRGAVAQAGGRRALRSLRDPDHVARTVDVAWNAALQAFETQTGAPIRCISAAPLMGPAPVVGPDALALTLKTANGGGVLRCETPQALMAALRNVPLPRLGGRAHQIRTPLSFEIATCDLTVSDMRHLGTADVLIPNRPVVPHIGNVVFGRWRAAARIEAGHLHIEEDLQMDDISEAGSTDPQGPCPVDDVTVTLRIEAARLDLSIAALSALHAGQVIDLPDMSPDDVAILANGQTIARGALVQIGETVGVQITRLCDHA